MQIWVILKDANCASAPCIDKLLILILYWLYIWYSLLNLCNLAMYLMSSKLGYHPQNPRKSGKIPRKVAKSPEKWLKKSHCLNLARIACEVKNCLFLYIQKTFLTVSSYFLVLWNKKGPYYLTDRTFKLFVIT